jgi:hypothetical protein
VSPRVHPAAIAPQGESESRSTSPVDSVILEDFHRQPEASLHYVYNHSGGTRRFRIQPTKRRMLFNFFEKRFEIIIYCRSERFKTEYITTAKN